MIRAKYISNEQDISFTLNKVYECERDEDGFGAHYNIIDDSGEWYRYSVEYFESYFEIVQM